MKVKNQESRIKVQHNSTKNVRDGVNVTPMIVREEPVVNKQFKSVLEEIFRFVSVGGDFI